MFKSKNMLVSANRLAVTRNISFNNENAAKKLIDATTKSNNKLLHTSTSRSNLAAAAILPLPQNIDATETTRFSPLRSRDITANVLSTQNIDITADNSMNNVVADISTTGSFSMGDPHVQSYDCFGAVSLNSVMQSNVPNPFGGMHKFSHLNMPGGQWSQEGKFTAQNLQSSHYTSLRNDARAGWLTYDQNATISNQKAHVYATNQQHQHLHLKRNYCTEVKKDDKPEPPVGKLSKKEQLKKAFKDYGTTIVVFHVAISLVSLGGFYALVSSGIDMMPVLEYLGLTSTTLANKLAAGASTFVVAYAIHKIFAPVRISITLASTPFIVRYLRTKGFLKPQLKK